MGSGIGRDLLLRFGVKRNGGEEQPIMIPIRSSLDEDGVGQLMRPPSHRKACLALPPLGRSCESANDTETTEVVGGGPRGAAKDGYAEESRKKSGSSRAIAANATSAPAPLAPVW